MVFEPASDILSHITVLDLTRVRSGPTCACQLADWGAMLSRLRHHMRQVRIWAAHVKAQIFMTTGTSVQLFSISSMNLVWPFLNACKPRRCDCGELTAGRKIAPSVSTMKRSGQSIRASSMHRSPALAKMGCLATRPGFDQIAQGMGGLMSITKAPGEGPMRVGIPIADLTAGGFAAQGVLLALLGREKQVGQWVQTSLLQAQIAMLDSQATRH